MKLRIIALLLLISVLPACTTLEGLIEAGGGLLAPPTASSTDPAAAATPAFPVPLYSGDATQVVNVEATVQEPSPDLPQVPLVFATPGAPPGTPDPDLPPVPLRPAGPIAAANPEAYYAPQPGIPVWTRNFAYPQLGCSWMGVGGQVFGFDGWPVSNLVVELGGSLEGQEVSMLALTGSAQQWGPGGYEFTLATRPLRSDQSLFLLFFDLDGNIVSDQIFFTTYDDCERNTVMINLVQSERPGIDIFLPQIPNEQPQEGGGG